MFGRISCMKARTVDSFTLCRHTKTSEVIKPYKFARTASAPRAGGGAPQSGEPVWPPPVVLTQGGEPDLNKLPALVVDVLHDSAAELVCWVVFRADPFNPKVQFPLARL